MEVINIREALLKIDRETDCEYDLTTLYESCNLSEAKKKELVKMIANYDSPEALGSLMSKSSGMPNMMENVSDDLSDDEMHELEEGAFGDLVKVAKAAGKALKNETPIGRAVTNIARGIKQDAKTLYKKSGLKNVVDATKAAAKDTDIYKNYKADEGADKVVKKIEQQKGNMRHPDNLSKYLERMKKDYPLFDYNSSKSTIAAEVKAICDEKGWDFEQVLKKAGVTMQESLHESIDASSLESEIRTEVSNIIDDVDMPVVEFSDNGDTIRIEVRAELNYDMLMDVAQKLDSIVSKYDNSAYFEPETAGILVAVVDKEGRDNSVDFDTAEYWCDKFNKCATKDEVRDVYGDFVKERDNMSQGTIDTIYSVVDDVFDELTEGYKYLEEDLDRIFEEVNNDDKIATNDKGDYLVLSSSGKGYTAFNKNDVCIGGIDSENEEEAKNKFMSGKLNEAFNDNALYLFHELIDEDKEVLKTYGLNYLGRNYGPDGSEDNWVVTGPISALEKFASQWLGYELHPDYLYDDADDFAGEIIKEAIELTNCPNCGGERFNDERGFCVDCGYDEKAHGELDESATSTYEVSYYMDSLDDNIMSGPTTTKKIQASSEEEAKKILMNTCEDKYYIPTITKIVKLNESKSIKENNDERFTLVRTKSVVDSDGFNTDYTMYYDHDNDKYVFVFGDKDIYTPEDGYFDWESETIEQAYQWFDSYNGFEDFEDDDYIEDEYLQERNLTKAERHNRNMDKIFDYKKSTDDKMMQFLRDNSELSEEEIKKAYDDGKLGLKLKELGLHDAFWSKNESLKESDEEEPYTKEQVEADLKSITHNFTDKDGDLKCGFEEEKNFGVEILKKHYEVVEASGDDRRDGNWYHISFANPKK